VEQLSRRPPCDAEPEVVGEWINAEAAIMAMAMAMG
jgi:hypothetical protein